MGDKFYCIECYRLLSTAQLLLLHPKKGDGQKVFTHEPDFFCLRCAKEVAIDHLPKHDIAKWLAERPAV